MQQPHPQYTPQQQVAYAPQQGYPQQQYVQPQQGYPQQQFYPQQQYVQPQQGYSQQAPIVTTIQPVQTVQVMQIVPSQNGSLLDSIFGPNDKILVCQRIEPLEVIIGFETENKYDVHFGNGIRAVAAEESGVMSRWCLGNKRPFTMHVYFKDNKQEFLRLTRPFKFYFEELQVIDPITNQQLGKVKRDFAICEKNMSVYDETGKLVYRIISPFCDFWTFHIEKNGTRVGEIKKKWSGFIKEFISDADNFGIQYPQQATPKDKALIFAATFLIDFLYFETNGNNNRRRNRY
jgi:hypothetical protein